MNKNDGTTAIESAASHPTLRTMKSVITVGVPDYGPDAGKRITFEGDVLGTELFHPPGGWRELVLDVNTGGESNFSVSIDLGAADGRFMNILELNPDLTAVIYKGLIDMRFGPMSVSWQSIGGNLSAHRWRFELARRCRQYERRSRYEVSPYEIYARLYNRAHPERHISAKRLNRLQIQRALNLFYHHQMPADYRRQR